MSWRLFEITVQCFRTLEPISGMDGMGWDEMGWDGMVISGFDDV